MKEYRPLRWEAATAQHQHPVGSLVLVWSFNGEHSNLGCACVNQWFSVTACLETGIGHRV
jgi:hypothetical protein